MKSINVGRCLLSLLTLFGILSTSLGDEESAAIANVTATANPTDGFELNDLLPSLENGDSFVDNYIMGKPKFYREEYNPVSGMRTLKSLCNVALTLECDEAHFLVPFSNAPNV